MIRRLLLSLIVLTIGASASGQNIVTDFSSSIKGRCITFGYSYSVSGQVPLTGSGDIMFQGESFVMKGDGLEIYCNGSDRWTVDVPSEECYIESVNQSTLDVEANPALLVSSVDKAFNYQKTKSSTFNGKNVTEAVLTPASKDGNIKEVSFFLSMSKIPVGAIITAEDGTTIAITINDYASTGLVDEKQFSLDTGKLGKDYIITDLR